MLCSPVAASASPDHAADPYGLAYRARPAMALTAPWAGDDPPGVYEAISRLRELDADWDSYGAAPLSSVTLTIAKRFVFDLYRLADLRGYSLPEPSVAPSPDGSVDFVWRSPSEDSDLEVLVRADGISAVGTKRGEVFECSFESHPVMRALDLLHNEIMVAQGR